MHLDSDSIGQQPVTVTSAHEWRSRVLEIRCEKYHFCIISEQGSEAYRDLRKNGELHAMKCVRFEMYAACKVYLSYI